MDGRIIALVWAAKALLASIWLLKPAGAFCENLKSHLSDLVLRVEGRGVRPDADSKHSPNKRRVKRLSADLAH